MSSLGWSDGEGFDAVISSFEAVIDIANQRFGTAERKTNEVNTAGAQ
jgi:hypothetical protein